MRTHLIQALTLTALVLPAQPPWTPEELEPHLQGFLEGSVRRRLEQVADLVAHKEQAHLAIANRIHGNYQEYLLEIRRLLEMLTDERWRKREEATNLLVEKGGRARSAIEEVASSGKTLEERLRCQQVLERLNARGTEKEDREARQLRGLVAAAPYLQTDDRLREALRSARGHADSQVAEGALRALGAIGGDSEAEFLRREVEGGPASYRTTALAALGRNPSARALALLRELVAQDKVSPPEIIAMIRDLRPRADAQPLLQEFCAHKDTLVQAAAKAALQLPAADGSPAEIRVVLGDQSQLVGRFLGFRGDGVVLGEAIRGLPAVELPLREIDSLLFQTAGKPGEARAFLVRGSLVCGKVTAFDAGAVTLATRVFGSVRLPREELQGIAIDPKLDRLLGGSPTADKLRLADGRQIEGQLASFDGTTWILQQQDGKAVRIPAAEVAGVLFRRPPPVPDPQRYLRVELVSGDRLLGHVAACDHARLALVAPGLGTAVIPCREIARLEHDVAAGATWGFTLIADYSDNCVVEVDEQGKEVFRMDNVLGAWDAECLDSGNLLVTEFAVGQVKEVTRAGEVVWSFSDLKNPYCATRLGNGNTLIADTFANRVIEVTKAGEIAWKYDRGVKPADCERLPNGNTLIADMSKDRVIEVSPAGDVVWEIRNMLGVYDVDRLSNGNTLVTLRMLTKVIEIDRDGKVVWQIGNLNSPSDADRLANGNTLVAENGGVREFDRAGNVVWKKTMSWAVEVNRY